MSGANFYAPQYDPKSLYTDGCTSGACMNTLGASSSLTQGQEFDRITAPLHGGRRSRKARRNNHMMRGGGDMAAYPSQFSEMLPQDMHNSARIGALDTSFSELPQFIGKYGNQTGGKRSSTRRGRRASRRHRGGMAPLNMPSMLLTPEEEPAAMLNPQWYDENLVVPSFQGPVNSYAQQAYENQIAYQNHNPGAMPVPPTPPPATGGGRRRRNNKNNTRKNNKKNRKSRRRARRTLSKF